MKYNIKSTSLEEFWGKQYDDSIYLWAGAKHNFPLSKIEKTEYVANNIICLPIYSHMNLDMVEKICYAIDRIQRYKT